MQFKKKMSFLFHTLIMNTFIYAFKKIEAFGKILDESVLKLFNFSEKIIGELHIFLETTYSSNI